MDGGSEDKTRDTRQRVSESKPILLPLAKTDRGKIEMTRKRSTVHTGQ